MKSKLLNMKSKSVSLRYLIVVFVLSYVWQLVIYLTLGIDSGMIPILMLFPAIVAVAFRILAKEGSRNVGWGLGKWWYVFAAVLVPLGVAFAIVLLLNSMNWATLSGTIFVFQDGMLTHSRIGLMLGNQPQSIPFFVLTGRVQVSVSLRLSSYLFEINTTKVHTHINLCFLFESFYD